MHRLIDRGSYQYLKFPSCIHLLYFNIIPDDNDRTMKLKSFVVKSDGVLF